MIDQSSLDGEVLSSIDRPLPDGNDLLDLLREPLRSRARLVVERQRMGTKVTLKTAEIDALLAAREKV